jgi:hypothetical protein
MADHEEEEGMDPIEYLGSLLQTDEGETIPDVIKALVHQLETQNKILVKIVSALKPPTPPS